MSYDADDYAPIQGAAPLPLPVAHPRDLEAIVTLLELAAIDLTPKPETEFTRDDLLARVRSIAGPDFELVDGDVAIVLKTWRGVRRVGADRYVLR
jgi:hypothetical protein